MKLLRSRPLAALGLALAAGLAGAATGSAAQTPGGAPLVAGYGKVTPVENAGERPDPAMDYKVVMIVTKAGGPNTPPEALNKAARLANLLAEAGVPPEHRHIVAILYGPATMAVLNAAGLKARGKTVNPSADLIARLVRAGVSVHVCGQALAGAKILRSQVIPSIQVDLSALTTISGLELKGYALIPD